MSEDYVERLARAWCPSSWDSNSPCRRGYYLNQTKRALTAIAATGCKVVGREPTEAMVRAYFNDMDASVADDFRAMVDAAPPYPGADEPK